jgi:hypothetical protein
MGCGPCFIINIETESEQECIDILENLKTAGVKVSYEVDTRGSTRDLTFLSGTIQHQDCSFDIRYVDSVGNEYAANQLPGICIGYYVLYNEKLNNLPKIISSLIDLIRFLPKNVKYKQYATGYTV